jgi:hypothetical protein
MPVLTMAPTLGDLLKYELNANYCRETVTLKAGTNYTLGSVLGKITGSGKYRLSPAAQSPGMRAQKPRSRSCSKQSMHPWATRRDSWWHAVLQSYPRQCSPSMRLSICRLRKRPSMLSLPAPESSRAIPPDPTPEAPRHHCRPRWTAIEALPI